MTNFKEDRARKFARGTGLNVRFKGSANIRSLAPMKAFDRPGFLVTNEAELRAALADPTIDRIEIANEIVITNPASVNDTGLLIDRPVTIMGGGTIASEASSGAAITFIRIASNDVTLRNITVKHRRPAASAGQIDRAILVQAERFMSSMVNVEFMEFGYWMEGSFIVEAGTTTYTGPLSNSHRHFGMYSLTGDSTVRDHVFDFPFEATPRSVFMLSNQSISGRKFDGKLTLDRVRQKRVSTSITDGSKYHYMSQFFVQQSFAASSADRTNMALEFRKCEWDDISGGAFIFNNSDNPLSQYASITLTDNVQGIGTLIDSYFREPVGDPSSPGRFKGMFFVDGTSGTNRPLGNASVLTMSGNRVPGVVTPGDTIRPGFTYLNPTGQQANVFAYNDARYVPST